MVDIHSHILPLDDGAINIEETLNMLKEAKEAGFKNIICTPHYQINLYQISVELKERLISDLKLIIQKENIGINLYTGTEIYYSNNILEMLKNGTVCSLNKSKYVLFELPFTDKPVFLNDVIFKLQNEGFQPIIAHPERYIFVQKDPNILLDYIYTGVLFQGNYGSIIGNYGRKAKETLIKLLKSNMIHFLASDAHKPKMIYNNINNIKKQLEKIIDNKTMLKLSLINPTCILENEEIIIEEPIEIKKSMFTKKG